MILYCYITHNAKVIEDSQHIQQTMLDINYSHYKIFYCGQDLKLKDKTIIHLECNDFYEGLPNKIHNICQFINSSYLKNYYSHIYKIDATNKIKKIVPIVDNQDYYGFILYNQNVVEFRRRYHFGRCSKDSLWNTKRYDGEFVPYCAGGYGYVLSSKAIECIANNPNNDNEDIYEDLYVAQTLKKCNIKPHYFDTRPYLATL